MLVSKLLDLARLRLDMVLQLVMSLTIKFMQMVRMKVIKLLWQLMLLTIP